MSAYFGHQANASKDPKMIMLRAKFKSEGIDVKWRIDELITEGISPKNLSCRLEHTSELLALDLGIPENRIKDILTYMTSLKLIYNMGGHYFNPRLLKYAGKYIRDAIPRILEVSNMLIRLLESGKIITRLLPSPGYSLVDKEVEVMLREVEVKKNKKKVKAVDVTDSSPIPIPSDPRQREKELRDLNKSLFTASSEEEQKRIQQRIRLLQTN